MTSLDFRVALYRAAKSGAVAHLEPSEVARVAVHEAGHSIAAVRLPGLGLYYANLTQTADQDGETRVFSNWKDAEISHVVIWKLAGGLAERRFSGSTVWPGSARADLTDARLLIKISTRPQDRDDAWSAYELLAESYVVGWWPQIERVAIELARRGELVGSRVRKIMEET